jgi:hypothetical protein
VDQASDAVALDALFPFHEHGESAAAGDRDLFDRSLDGPTRPDQPIAAAARPEAGRSVAAL